jgi:hypothetical protein
LTGSRSLLCAKTALRCGGKFDRNNSVTVSPIATCVACARFQASGLALFVTGFTSNEATLVGKRLEILKEISPRMTRVLYIRSSRPQTLPLFQRATEGARLLGLAITDGIANSDAEIDSAIALFAREQDGGLIIAFDAFNIVHSETIITLAARHHLPAIYF